MCNNKSCRIKNSCAEKPFYELRVGKICCVCAAVWLTVDNAGCCCCFAVEVVLFQIYTDIRNCNDSHRRHDTKEGRGNKFKVDLKFSREVCG